MFQQTKLMICLKFFFLNFHNKKNLTPIKFISIKNGRRQVRLVSNQRHCFLFSIPLNLISGLSRPGIIYFHKSIDFFQHLLITTGPRPDSFHNPVLPKTRKMLSCRTTGIISEIFLITNVSLVFGEAQ